MIIKKLLNMAGILIAVLLLLVVSTGAFIGAGYILSIMLPFTLFQASLLVMGATFVVAFIISAIFILGKMTQTYNDEDLDYEDYDEDDDEDFEEEEYANDSERKVRYVKSKVGRNDPCPCGSGKKYKNCCGK